MAKARTKGRTEDSDAEPPDPTIAAVQAAARGALRRDVALLALVVLLSGVSVWQLVSERRQAAAVDELGARLDSVLVRFDENVARVQDQTARTRAGVEVLRNDLGQIKSQLATLGRGPLNADGASQSEP